ncbi:BspA family leucine-rich repeat surface protein [Olleya sp. HaHaR_3_96]|uniref:BspA family leucine-rich repeat surface protein n=1 Tax=Olleya sp. HaHaR_3_96 TaxID=2745560 RepID=UPI001C4F5387|nr:BspA family leucine-rich repeat surface protein [Olleya sp. HaHaR_3_96]QXP60853.1 BspA family leucine-rich repeat surface protein [Olleya sp. HaHaR_3_96]
MKYTITLLFLFLSLTSFSQTEFSSLWNTSNTDTGTSAINEIEIPTNPAYTYNYNVDWGDGQTDTGVTGDITHTYATPNTYTITIDGTFPSIYFNNQGDKLKIIEILNWGNIQWQTMENAFYGCENLNFDAIGAPDLSQVTTLKNMFKNAESFNGIINHWDVSSITDLSGLFYGATTFNRPLDLWNTGSVIDMSETFYNTSSFNEPLDNWNTAQVTTMSKMFHYAASFNQNINGWEVTRVTDMSYTFYNASAFNSPLSSWLVNNVTTMSNMFAYSGFNQPIEIWNVSNVEDMSYMFYRNTVFNQPLNDWIVSNVTNMSHMFDGYYWTTTFNQPINNWDVSNVTNMSFMFRDNKYFNQPLNSWIVTAVTNMESMFESASRFNEDITVWDVSNVTKMSSMFESAYVFNQDITGWIVSNVTNMSAMFQYANAFNQAITGWDVSNVTDMNSMFYSADAFNQPLDIWDVSKVRNMSSMFNRALTFNQPLNGWQTSAVTNMSYMFYTYNVVTVFNQPLNSWDTSSVTNMSSMFGNAATFDQSLSSWNINNVSNMSDMLDNSGLSQTNYDNTLISWELQPVRDNVTLGAQGLNYCDSREERQNLIDNSSWTINDDIINCSFVLCTSLVSPANGDTNVPANTNLTWEAVPGATGYKISYRIENGGTITATETNLDVGNVTSLDLTSDLTPGDTVYITIVPYNTTDGDAIGCTEESFTVISSWVNDPTAFKLTIDTSIAQSYTSDANQLEIDTNSGYPDYLTYNYSIDWGDNQFNNNVTGDITHTYLVPGIYTISIIGDYPAHYYSSYFSDSKKLLSIDQWGTQQWQSMKDAFYGCSNMEYNATDKPDLSQVTTAYRMFGSASLFNGDINDWDVSNIEDMSSMFQSASDFNQPLNDWDVSNVTNMSSMFSSASDFDQPLDNWITSNVTNMSGMFSYSNAFNQNINSWDVSAVTTMRQMFNRASLFNQPLLGWDVTSVTDMESMFNNAPVFDQPIDIWTVNNVTNMSSMFENATAFNQNINSWNVTAVTDMSSMFQSATNFNMPLDNWVPIAVTNMQSMFESAITFNQNISAWNVTNVINMASTFESAKAFNKPLNGWDVNSVVDMTSMFESAEAFNQPLNLWDVSAVANMTSMFEKALVFNQDLNDWTVSSVTLMPSMFENASAFNSPINDWTVASVTNMESMFKNAIVFNQTLNNWNTGEVLTMAEMFSGASAFNQNIDIWNVSFVATMEAMFKNAISYNQTMNSWNVASVRTMEEMFRGASVFNETIDGWNVRGVITMEEMFYDAIAFNQTLNSWRVTNVSNMISMFRNATAFDQNLDDWIIGTTNMKYMFSNATAFNQPLSAWDVSHVTDMQYMLDYTALSRENYDETLIAWSELVLNYNINLGAQTLLYCDAEVQRQSMIDTYGWTFTGDILDCPIPTCTQLISPANGDIDVPVNTNLTWERALYARGYTLTVVTQPGNILLVDNEIVTETSYQFLTDFSGGELVEVTIIPFNDEGEPLACTMESFTITNNSIATVPDCTTLTLPLHGSIDIPVDTDLEWEPIANADGYRITVGTTSGGSDILNDIDVANVTAYQLTTDLPENTIIYVQITPYNTIGDAITCAEESFTTETIPVAPECTSLTLPLNGTTDVSIDTDFSWNAVPNATGYLLSVGTTGGGIEILNSIDVGNVTTYDLPDNLGTNRLIFVNITPYNAVGDAIGCTEESFRTGDSASTDPPNCTTLTAPLNNATDVDITTDLSWTAITEATGYTISVGTTTGGTDILALTDVGNVITYNLASDLPETSTIFVTIAPYNAVASATGCSEESFTTETLPTPPNCTTLTTPLNNATDVDITTDLSWTAATDATGYIISVGTTSGGTDILDNEDVGNVITYNLASDLPETSTIYVTITPYNAVGNATGCAEESFTTETLPTPPNCTTLTTPLNNATDVDITTDLSWTAATDTTGYIISVGTTTGGTDILDNEDVGNVIIYNLASDLPETATLYVTITPYNAVGNATGCTEESFTTETLPTPPNCTTLTTPLNNATDVDITTDLSWTAATDATGYIISVGTTTGGTDILDNEDVGNVITYDLASDLPETSIIYVTITPYNAVGNATGCSEESFTTETLPTPPNCTTLTTPLNNATDVDITSDLSWTAATDTTGYIISVGTTTGGTDILDNEDVGNVITYNLASDLPETSTIYVTITPYNAVGNATGCIEESFTTETLPTPPNCTTLTTPLNNATDVDITTDLSWTAATDATGYIISVGTTTGGTDILDNEDVGNVITYNLASDLPETATLYVTITPYNAVGNATGCIEESFTTETLPTPPNCTTLTTPLNNATDVDITTDLSWNVATDATGYIISVGTTTGGTDILDNEDVGNVITYNLASDLPETATLYVTITPYNAIGNATGCAEESFTTETLPTPPNCTTLTTPLNNATEVDITTDLSWTAATDATGYIISVGTTTGGTDILDNEDVGNVITYNLASDLPETSTIYVTITPYNAVGNATGCAEESFTTETLPTPPNCTTLTTPLNNATDVDITTDLSWNAATDATGYIISVGTTSGGTDILDNEDIGNVITYNLASDLPETAIIYVTITPYNAIGNATGCTEESFTTETLPTPPNCTTLTTPLNNATDVDITTDLSWTAATDATGYIISAGTTSGGTDILDNEDVGNVITYNLVSYLPETSNIFVTITPYNAVGNATGCTEAIFATETLLYPPTCTTLINPIHNETDVALDTSIDWEFVATADGYTISIGSTSGGTDIVNNQDVGNATSYTLIEDLLQNQSYYVTVTPYNIDGEAQDCTESVFTTLTIPKNDVKYGFSPDNDGINDFWHIEGIEMNPNNTVTIFNRWGDMVFQIENYNNTTNVFRGIANKKTKMGADVLPEGTYFFQFDIDGPHNFDKLKGFVIIKR